MARPRRIFVELLEERCIPAVFGVGWALPQHITLSFVGDGTLVDGRPSTLFQTLDATRPTADWQRVILKAAEAWASVTNIGISLVTDGNQPMGTTGAVQGDSRFGDIRIAARELSPDTRALAVLHDPFLSGTRAGDIVLNDALFVPGAEDVLEGVMLHEIGHALGLDEIDDPNSIMGSNAQASLTDLSPLDIAAIRGLYGTRSNGSGTTDYNDTMVEADWISVFPGFDGQTPIVTYGAVETANDTDYYRIRPRFSGPMTIRLQSAGVSLLSPKLTVLDPEGRPLATSSSNQLGGDRLSVTIPNTVHSAHYYIKIESASSDGFDFGNYGIAVSRDATLSVTSSQIDAVLRGPYEHLSAQQIDMIFRDPDDVDLDPYAGLNDDFETAFPLLTTSGSSESPQGQAFGSLRESGDSAFYVVHAPLDANGAPAVLTASVNAHAFRGVSARLRLYSADQTPVESRQLVSDAGTFSLQASGLTPGAIYYLRVDALNAEEDAEGNFTIVADFTQPEEIYREFASGILDDAVPESDSAFYVARSQIFRFDLTGRSIYPTTDATLRLLITDSAGEIVLDLGRNLDSPEGKASGFVFLRPGAYAVKIIPDSPYGLYDALPVEYRVQGAALSDPIGPALTDPTYDPVYQDPLDPEAYVFPVIGSITDPFYWLGLLP